MKIFSVQNPYAFLLLCGAKRWETRPRPTKHRGPLAIASSASINREARAAFRKPEVREELAAAGVDPDRAIELLPGGVILGVVTVVNCLSIDEMARAAGGTLNACRQPWSGVHPGRHEWYLGDYGKGRFAYLTRNPRLLATPIDARLCNYCNAVGELGRCCRSTDCRAKISDDCRRAGRLGLWDFPEEEILSRLAPADLAGNSPRDPSRS